MDGLDDEETSGGSKFKKEELDEELKKQKAKETLKQVKAEMGMLYNEIEKHADEIKTEKTIGNKKPSPDSTENSSDSTK
jgi:hypothetical protein